MTFVEIEDKLRSENMKTFLIAKVSFCFEHCIAFSATHPRIGTRDLHYPHHCRPARQNRLSLCHLFPIVAQAHSSQVCCWLSQLSRREQRASARRWLHHGQHGSKVYQLQGYVSALELLLMKLMPAEMGHISKNCPQERVDFEKAEISCSNCKEVGHRVRDW